MNIKRAKEEIEHTVKACLLYTSDAADEEDSVDLGGPGGIKKKKIDRWRGIRQKEQSKNRKLLKVSKNSKSRAIPDKSVTV